MGDGKPVKSATTLKPQGNDVQVVTVQEPVSPLQVFALRGAIVGVGLLGAYLIARNSKVFARFKHVKQIPDVYIRKETKLKGVIRALDSNGIFKVEHQPEIGLPRFLQPRQHQIELLRLRPAGLDVSKAGVDYLVKDLKLKDKPIIFNVVKTTSGDPDTADADITIKKSFFGAMNLNIDLIRKGYAKVYTLETPAHYKALQKNSVYSRLVTRLLTSEKVAEKRGIGLWERESWVETVQSLPYAATQMVRSSSVTKFFVLLGRMFYDLCTLLAAVLRQLYYFSVASADYASVAYRAFGQRIDRLTKFYDRTKLRLQQRRLGVQQQKASPPAVKKEE